MSQSSDVESPEVEISQAATPAAARPEKSPAAGMPLQISVDAAGSRACYANFCRVTGTPEELIIDFALNAHPFGSSTEPLRIEQRVVTNYFTAKRMLAALQLSVARHEAAFGVLEVDVNKRAQAGRS